MGLILMVFISIIVAIVAIKRIINKKYFSMLIACFIGVYIPLLIYFFRWTDRFVEEISIGFCVTFISFGAMVLLIPYVDNITGNRHQNRFYDIQYRSRVPFDFYNALYLACFFAENYLLSGYLLPAVQGINIHTSRVGILVYITNTTFIAIIGNYLCFYTTRKKRYLVWAIIIAILPIVGKGSRIESALAVCQVVIIAYYLWWTNGGRFIQDSIEVKKYKRKRRIIIIVAVISVCVLINYGIYRTSVLGFTTSYSQGIKYTGPGGEIGAWMYGYFVFPLNNLNNNILNNSIDGNCFGFSAFKSLWFGILHISKFTNLYSDAAVKNALVLTSSCNVNTGFWDFYYDYGLFIIFPFLLCMIFYAILSVQKNRLRAKIGDVICFFYWSSLWLFMCFNNTVGFDFVLSNMLLIHLIFNRMFRLTIYEQEFTLFKAQKGD